MWTSPRHLLTDRFRESAGAPLITTLNDQTFSYAEAWRAAAGLADRWRDLGCKRGDVIAFLLPNSVALPIAYLSCAVGGFVACPIPPTHHPDFIAKLLSLVSPALLVKEAPPLDTSSSRSSVEIGGGENDPFFLLFTSGSTGEPKVICHSLNNIIGSAAAFARLTGMSAGTRLYHVLPMSYMAGILNAFFAPLAAGASIVEGGLFSPATLVDFWSRPLKTGVNTLSLTPTIAAALHRITKHPPTVEAVKARMVQVQCTSAPIPRALQRDFFDLFSLPLQNCYGMTELGGPLTFQTKEDAERFEDWSVPIDELEVSLRGSSEQKELWIKSPFTMLGYLENGRLSSPLDARGFLDTGDLAMGLGRKIRITGRKKDLIIRGGLNVSPARVEAVLGGMPGLEDIAVVGVNHPFWGEAIVACVISKTDDAEIAAKVAQFGRDHLSPHERPDHVLAMREFPRLFMGKIDKTKLRESVVSRLDREKTRAAEHS